MCPLSVAVECGRWFLINFGVRLEMVASSSLQSSAPRIVDAGREHMIWWMQWAYSAVEHVVSTLVANAVVGAAVRGTWLSVAVGRVAWYPAFLVKNTIHNKLVQPLSWPQMMVQLRWLMVQLIFVKVSMRPALHMVTTESNDWWDAWGLARRSGRSSVQVCVGCTLSLLGRQAMRGTAVRTMLVVSALVVRKWLVALESRMTYLDSSGIGID
jgi:hypothetical protein